jgi:hypothetical protein
MLISWLRSTSSASTREPGFCWEVDMMRVVLAGIWAPRRWARATTMKRL